VQTVQRDTRWHGGASDEAEDGAASMRVSRELPVHPLAQGVHGGSHGEPSRRSAPGSEIGLRMAGRHDDASRDPELGPGAGAPTHDGLAPGDDALAPGTDPDQAQLAPLVVEIPPFAEVFRTYSAFVWRVLLRLGVAEADVDDVAQEVFLGIHRNLSRFEGRCSLRTWVYGICHRRAVDYRRRASVRPELYSDEPPEQSVAANQEQGFAVSQARQQLARVLDGLDEEKRTVFVLFDIEGVPMDEVAEIVGCPLQTAYSRLYAARRKVEATLARQRADRRSV
jgi:RNA polymerase sigma-70 factor (ECF subfamily)